jgi:hypothetical protein
MDLIEGYNLIDDMIQIEFTVWKQQYEPNLDPKTNDV